MRKWFLKTFKAHKIVKLLVAFEDGRVKEYIEIPNNDGTVIIKPDLAFLLKDECRLLSENNIPTFLFTYKSAGAVQIHNIPQLAEGLEPPYRVQDGVRIPYDAKNFSLAIDNTVAFDVFKANKGGQFRRDLFMILGGMVAMFFIFGYFFNNQLSEAITEIVSTISNSGGGEIIG